MDSATEGSMNGAPAAWCVLWTSRGTEPPPALMRVLEQRRLSIVRVAHRFHALAELALAQSRMKSAIAPGPRGPILLLHEPGTLDGAADVVRLSSIYAPFALHWQYQAASTPKLGIYIAPSPARGAHEVVVMPAARSNGVSNGAPMPRTEDRVARPPELRLSGSDEPPTRMAPAMAFNDTATPRPPELRLVTTEPTRNGGHLERAELSTVSADKTATSTARSPISPSPSERPDFSRIITEDELTMLLDDRAPSNRPPNGQTR
jgi:hypothetical protein